MKHSSKPPRNEEKIKAVGTAEVSQEETHPTQPKSKNVTPLVPEDKLEMTTPGVL